MVLTADSFSDEDFSFSLFHELGHIVNGDAGGAGNFIDYNKNAEIEEKADRFARMHIADENAI